MMMMTISSALPTVPPVAQELGGPSLAVGAFRLEKVAE